MNFPQDGGLSCVRHFLEVRSGPLEDLVRGRLRSRTHVVGTLVCVCGADAHWEVGVGRDHPVVRASCGCNGSQLPIYVGAPPSGMEIVRAACPCIVLTLYKRGWIAVGIGYAADLPPVGTIDAERAQELCVAAQCAHCSASRVVLHVKLDRPPDIRGDEPWIRRIQGLG